MMARMDYQLQKMKACLEKMEATDLEAWWLASSCRALQKAKEKDQGRWWVLEEVGCRLQRNDPPCRSGMA
jgi:hypothetical protein